jgi:hypothetical protein
VIGLQPPQYQGKTQEFRHAERWFPLCGTVTIPAAETSMQRAETIRSLQRGLAVLKVLQANAIASLHDIHVASFETEPAAHPQYIRRGWRRLAPPR